MDKNRNITAIIIGSVLILIGVLALFGNFFNTLYSLCHDRVYQKIWLIGSYRGIVRILGCMRAYARIHPKIRGSTTAIPKDPKILSSPKLGSLGSPAKVSVFEPPNAGVHHGNS